MIRQPRRLATLVAVILLPCGPGWANEGAVAGDPARDGGEEPRAGIVFGRALEIEGTPVRLRAVRPAQGAPGLSNFVSRYQGPFAAPKGLPVRATRISSGYGSRWHPVLGGSRFHAGMDFPAPTGTPVYATAPGMIAGAGWCGNYGYCVVIDHGRGYSTLFAHLSAVLVDSGSLIGSGQAVGRVGTTGLSTGPHLHYEVRQNGRPLDPGRYL